MKAVIVIEKGSVKETWGSLTEACKAHPEFKYSYLKEKKFPFRYKGFSFEKVPYRTPIIKE